MVTACSEGVMSEDKRAAFRRNLAELFSGYRAEWLKGEVFDLFTEPSYFPQLTISHPCFLVGGRGTGKTTALRCLSYQGQQALRGDALKAAEWPYFGMYYRVNTNRVRAFGGPELPESTWVRLFGHYVNLEFCELVLRLLRWYREVHPEAPELSVAALERVSVALHLSAEVVSHVELGSQLELTKLRFEAAINNIAGGDQAPSLSMQGSPIDALLREIKQLPQFQSKSFFFLIDEYENLEAYQQRVINTLIKHCGELYSFKVSVRELGFREHSTLNPDERLIHPADYKLIDITEQLDQRFADFAAEVCNSRLSRATVAANPLDVRELFPELVPEDEALALGVESAAAPIREEILSNGAVSAEQIEWVQNAHPLEVFTLGCRAKTDDLIVKLQEAIDNPRKWDEQYENYKHAYLFAIRRGKAGIRKYFAGWRVFCLLAASNIRYLLELVDQALTNHLDELDERDASEDDLVPVSPALQTKAAQSTGEKNLRELEGLSLSGAKLTRLLLGLGRVFQVMAEDPVGHTPEVNQFHLSADVAEEALRSRVEDLLREGIMNLALARYVGSKLQERSDVRHFDYAVHPIFTAFFGFSHRRKRKIELSDNDVWGLVSTPSEAITEILRRQKRSPEAALPEQVGLFSDYYALPH
jgi:hypothetical protein